MSISNMPPEPPSPRPDVTGEELPKVASLHVSTIKILEQFNEQVNTERKYEIELGEFITELEAKFGENVDINSLSRANLIDYMKLFKAHFPNEAGIQSIWDEEMDLEEMTTTVERIHTSILSGYKQKQEVDVNAKNATTSSQSASTGPGKGPIHPPSNMDTKHSKEAQGVTATSTSSIPGATTTSSTSSPTSTSTSPSTEKKPGTSTDVKTKATNVTTAYGAGATNGTAVPSPAATTSTSVSASTTPTTSATNAPQRTVPGAGVLPTGQQPAQPPQPQQSSLQFQGEAPQQSAEPTKPVPPLQHQYASLRNVASAKRLVDISANNPIIAEGDPGPKTEAQLKEANAKFSADIKREYGAYYVEAVYNDNDGSVKVTIPNKRNPENPQQHDELERRLENGKPKVKLTNPPDDVSIYILLEQNEDILPLKMSKLCPNNLDKTSHYTNLNTILRLMEASTISGRVIEFDPADMAAFDALKNSKDPAEQALLHRFDYLYALRQEQGPQLEAFKQHVKAEENAGRRWEYGHSTITPELLAQQPEPPESAAEPTSPGHN